MNKFDPNKPCALDNGTPVRILATTLKGTHPIVAAIPTHIGHEILATFNTEGFSHDDTGRLVNIKRVTLNVYEGPEQLCASTLPGPVEDQLGTVTITMIDGKLTAQVSQ